MRLIYIGFGGWWVSRGVSGCLAKLQIFSQIQPNYILYL